MHVILDVTPQQWHRTNELFLASSTHLFLLFPLLQWVINQPTTNLKVFEAEYLIPMSMLAKLHLIKGG